MRTLITRVLFIFNCNTGINIEFRDILRRFYMLLQLLIPAEFEKDYYTDKFKDFFSRVIADIDFSGLCGNYEKETA